LTTLFCCVLTNLYNFTLSTLSFHKFS
jgi:hypothetical protein